MGYDNRPKQLNNNKSYNQNRQWNTKTGVDNKRNISTNKFNNNNNNNNKFNHTKMNDVDACRPTFSAKDKDDIYTPKTYAKKIKEKSFFDEIVIPEYLEDRQRMRNKRENDKKYKNKRNH